MFVAHPLLQPVCWMFWNQNLLYFVNTYILVHPKHWEPRKNYKYFDIMFFSLEMKRKKKNFVDIKYYINVYCWCWNWNWNSIKCTELFTWLKLCHLNWRGCAQNKISLMHSIYFNKSIILKSAITEEQTPKKRVHFSVNNPLA